MPGLRNENGTLCPCITVSTLTDGSGNGAFTATGAGTWIESPYPVCTFEAALSNTTTPTATVEIHGSNSNTTTPGAGTLLGTITLSGASDVASLSKDSAAYRYKCAKVTAISGTSAAVTVTMGV
jgi:hypothetical protein